MTAPSTDGSCDSVRSDAVLRLATMSGRSSFVGFLCRSLERFLRRRLALRALDDLATLVARAERIGQHAARAFEQDVVIGFVAGVFIAFLDQEPLFLVAVAAHVALHEREAAVQLFAVEPEFQLALRVRFGRFFDRARLRLPRTAIPHDHAARAVIALGNHAFERAVVERMVLDVHGQPLHRRIEARTFRHGPRLERAIEFETEVVVQTARVVFLNHERERVGFRLRVPWPSQRSF